MRTKTEPTKKEAMTKRASGPGETGAAGAGTQDSPAGLRADHTPEKEAGGVRCGASGGARVEAQKRD